ncbi:MAG: v-type synthase subunit [Chlamydiota bacterium]|jgi:V/A-type H+-transporting ATPase subunit I
MIISMKKYLILGVKEEIDAFFEEVQKSAIAEFISMRPKKAVEHPIEIERLVQALKILRKLPLKKPHVLEGDLIFADEIAGKVIHLKAEVERLSEERRLLEVEKVRVAPFGDFSLEDIDFIEDTSKWSIQFFCRKSEAVHEDPVDDYTLFIGSDYDLDYFITVHKHRVLSPDKIEMRIDRPLGELETHLSFVKESLRELEAELKGYAGYIDFLHEKLLMQLDAYHLHEAKKQVCFPLENSLFSIEAWIPSNKVDQLFAQIHKRSIHCEEVVIEEHEVIPTYMENRGNVSIGEDLVRIYDIPASSDRDPSGWVFWFFVLFFSMIVNDGGYGLIYLAVCLYLKWKMPSMKEGMRRFLRLATILSCGCVLWGLLSASFFGIELSPKGWLSKASLIHYVVEKKADYHLQVKDDVYDVWVKEFPSIASAKTGEELIADGTKVKEHHIEYPIQDAFSDNIFLEFSLVLGMMHISLALLRYIRRHFAAIGWVLFIVGGYLYFPSLLHATSFVHFFGLLSKAQATGIGLQLIYTGIGSAIVLALLQKRWQGISEISTVITVFADILSYLRLYALGLSTAIMAETFNGLGQAVGLFLGMIVLLAGHGITIIMGLMTGTIHGLRLNFIEWYHHCFQGGGRLFSPLMSFIHKKE